MKGYMNGLLDRILAQSKKDGVQKIVVGGIVTVKGRVLFLKRQPDDFMPGLWELPSGKQEKGEGIIDCLKREVKEESGLDVLDVIDYVGHFDYTSGSGKKTRQFTFSVKCDPKAQVVLSEEHDGFTWLPGNQLTSYNISEEVRGQVNECLLARSLSTSPAELATLAYDQGKDRIVVGAVITNTAGKALVVKRSADDFMGGLYELPSGKVEHGKSLMGELTREVKEETNLDVTKVLSYVGSFDYLSGSGKKTRQLTFNVEVADSDKVALSEEHEGYAWVVSKEIPKYNISAETAAQIITVLSPAALGGSDEKRKSSDDMKRDSDGMSDPSDTKRGRSDDAKRRRVAPKSGVASQSGQFSAKKNLNGQGGSASTDMASTSPSKI